MIGRHREWVKTATDRHQRTLEDRKWMDKWEHPTRGAKMKKWVSLEDSPSQQRSHVRPPNLRKAQKLVDEAVWRLRRKASLYQRSGPSLALSQPCRPWWLSPQNQQELHLWGSGLGDTTTRPSPPPAKGKASKLHETEDEVKFSRLKQEAPTHVPHIHQDPTSQACAFLVRRLQESLNSEKTDHWQYWQLWVTPSPAKNVTVKLPRHQAEAPLKHFRGF